MLLSDIISIQASKAPKRVAMIAEDQEITFTDLNERAMRLANALTSVAETGDRVAILAQNIVEYVHCYYGVPLAGMILTLLNHRLNPAEWAWILNDAEARILIVQEEFLDQIEPILTGVPSLQTVVVVGSDGRHVNYEDFTSGANGTITTRRSDDDDVAWLIYTSGTTGRPKGAMLTHRSLLTSMFQTVGEAVLRRPLRGIASMPLCHISGIAVPLFNLVGESIVIQRTWDPEVFMRLVERYRVSRASLAPTMWTGVLDHPNLGDYDLSSLEIISYAGAPMPETMMKSCIEKLGVKFSIGFGMTELCGDCLIMPSELLDKIAAGEHGLLAGVGRPGFLADCKVIGADGVALGPNQVGELMVRSEQLMKGYWRDDEATKEAFSGGWFHTGDLARYDDEGCFYIVGRRKDMIITGSENVYAREVEDSIYRLDGVADVAVIGLPDSYWGERVAAVVVRRTGSELSERAVIDHVHRELGGYKAPKQVIFVAALPRNASGKILKGQLRDQYGDRGAEQTVGH